MRCVLLYFGIGQFTHICQGQNHDNVIIRMFHCQLSSTEKWVNTPHESSEHQTARISGGYAGVPIQSVYSCAIQGIFVQMRRGFDIMAVTVYHVFRPEQNVRHSVWQTIVSNAFPWMNMFVFWFKFLGKGPMYQGSFLLIWFYFNHSMDK